MSKVRFAVKVVVEACLCLRANGYFSFREGRLHPHCQHMSADVADLQQCLRIAIRHKFA